MADKYQPQVKSGTVNLKWGTNVTSDWNYEARNFITNDSSIPVSTSYKYLDPVNGQKGGTYTTRIQVTYADGSKEVVGSVTFVVPTTDVDKYQPTVHDVTLELALIILSVRTLLPIQQAISQMTQSCHNLSHHLIVHSLACTQIPKKHFPLRSQEPIRFTLR